MLRCTFRAALPPCVSTLRRRAPAPSLPRPRMLCTRPPPPQPRSAVPRGQKTVVDVYSWAYVNPLAVRFFDRDICVGVILWFYHRVLQRAVFAEVPRGTGRVLQANGVYGSYLVNLAKHLGPTCKALDVVDVMPIQVKGAARKLKPYDFARVWVDDATEVRGEQKYDAAIGYFLQHELPDAEKRAATDNILDNVAPGGKAVFVEYHRMARWHPLRPVMLLVWWLLEPFAKAMQRVDSVADWASADRRARFAWRKRTFFWGLYQVTVANRLR